jgi:hypothetical protein
VQNVLDKFLKVGTRIQSELACNPGKMGKRVSGSLNMPSDPSWGEFSSENGAGKAG